MDRGITYTPGRVWLTRTERIIVNELLAKLTQPFAPSTITWKPGATTKDGAKCLAMAYADLRAYQERLDAVCGMEWSVAYTPWGDHRMIACLTVAGVTRCSTGEMDAQDEKNNMGGTVAEAQAFKRAAAMFGLGRYLYNLPSVWVEFDASARRISKAGEAELDRRYQDWYARKTAQKPQERTNGAAVSQPAAPARSAAPGPAPQATDDAAAFNRMVPGANAGVAHIDGDVLFERAWYAAAQVALPQPIRKLADDLLALHRNNGGPCTAKQYGYLCGLLDSIIEQTGPYSSSVDGHKRVLLVLCQTDVSSTNRPSATMAGRLLARLATHIKDESGNKVINANYDQATADAMVAIYHAAKAVATP